MTAPANRVAELQDLLGMLRDGTLSEEQTVRLDQLLANDPAAQQYYAEAVDLLVTLRHYHGVPGQRSAPREAHAVGTEPVPRSVSQPRRWLGPLGVAAVFLLGLGLGLSYSTWGFRLSPDGSETSDVGPTNGVAVLTRVVDADWEPMALPTVVGSALPAGRLKLKSGLAQVEFYGGAAVVLEGPSEFELLSTLGGYCPRGKLRTKLLPSAAGFMVSTPTVDLVGPGAEFGLQVDDAGESQVHIFSGKVDLLKRQAGKAARQTLASSGGVRIGEDGVVRPAKVNAEAFVGVAEFERRSADEVARRYQGWTAISRKLKNDPRVILYYSFENQKPWERTLKNQAGDGGQGMLDGAIVGCQWIRGRWPGKGALEFKRPTDRVRLHVPGEFTSLSYVTWVRIDGFDRYLNSLLLTDGHLRGAPHWQVSSEGQVIFGVGGHRIDYSPPVLRPQAVGRWAQLAVVLNGETHTLTHYLDGEVIGTSPYYVSVPLRIDDAEIGNWHPGPRSGFPVRHFNGRIDEFIVFQQPLGPEEVRELYAIGKPTS